MQHQPAGSTADGVALALAAGAAVTDLEFVQFHPTVLYTRRHRTAAADLRGGPRRGRGPRRRAGRPVTAGVHPLGDLAPRDVVSRAIAARLRATGADHVFLDAPRIDDFAHRFPTVTASCLAAGIDPRTDPIPVAPAAHYSAAAS